MAKRDKKLRIFDPVSALENDSKGNSFRVVCTNQQENTELTVYECGWENCHNQHFCGPRVRDIYILHFVTDGQGEYFVENKTFALKKDNLFLVPPNIVTYYHADSENPWKYFWVGMNGTEVNRWVKAIGLVDGAYTMKAERPDMLSELFRNVSEYATIPSAQSKYAMLSNVYAILSELVSYVEILPERKTTNEYISNAIHYMNNHYDEKINIASISSYLGLERSYFYKIFKETMNVSPQEYLINVRLTNAQLLMKEGGLNLQQIARKVGYENYSNFLRLFNVRYGMTPKEYLKLEDGGNKSESEK